MVSVSAAAAAVARGGRGAHRLLFLQFQTLGCLGDGFMSTKAIGSQEAASQLPSPFSDRAASSGSFSTHSRQLCRWPGANGLNGCSVSLSSRPLSSSPASAATSSSVLHVQSSTEFKAAIRDAPVDRLLVVDFTASWCRPCQMIAPLLDALSVKRPDVTFLKVDIEESELQEAVEEAQIAAVPTFQFYKGGKVVSSFSGADINKLNDTIEVFQGAP